MSPRDDDVISTHGHWTSEPKVPNIAVQQASGVTTFIKMFCPKAFISF